MFPAIAVAFGTMRANPLRTILSTLGVIMGVAALVAVLSVGDGLERYTREQIQRTTGLHAIAIQPRTAVEVDGLNLPTEDYPRFTVTDLLALEPQVASAQRVALSLDGLAYLRHADSDSVRVVRVAGLAGRIPGDARPTFVAGRDLTREELTGDARLVVVGERLARSLGAEPARLIGDSLTIGEHRFQVVGVHSEEPGPPGHVVTVPFQVAEASLAPTRQARAPWIFLEAERVEDVAALRESTQAWIAGHRPTWEGRVEVQTNRTRLEQVSRGMLLFKLFMGAITGISLLVGGVGIMNVLLASIAERTREIGVRKATGARNRDILFQFLAESVTISGTGALLGIAGAFGTTALMRAKADAFVYAALSFSTVLVVAVAGIGIGLVFGVYPALRASRLSPIDSMRQE